MIPFIITDIIDSVIQQMEDADYDENAKVFIGNDMLLIDIADFEDLKKYCSNGLKEKRFEDIVKMRED